MKVGVRGNCSRNAFCSRHSSNAQNKRSLKWCLSQRWKKYMCCVKIWSKVCVNMDNNTGIHTMTTDADSIKLYVYFYCTSLQQWRLFFDWKINYFCNVASKYLKNLKKVLKSVCFWKNNLHFYNSLRLRDVTSFWRTCLTLRWRAGGNSNNNHDNCQNADLYSCSLWLISL